VIGNDFRSANKAKTKSTIQVLIQKLFLFNCTDCWPIVWFGSAVNAIYVQKRKTNKPNVLSMFVYLMKGKPKLLQLFILMLIVYTNQTRPISALASLVVVQRQPQSGYG
jgi:hypothetical protein